MKGFLPTFGLFGMLAFVLLLYFLLVRPQRKREERRALMVASVKPGSVIYAGGGIRCTVLEVRKDSVLAESGPGRSKLEFDADAIEAVEGFDYKGERSRQKMLREQRQLRNEEARKGGSSTGKGKGFTGPRLPNKRW